MTVLLKGAAEPFWLPADEAGAARDSSVALAGLAPGEMQPLTLRVEDRASGRQVEATISAPALRLLTRALALMGQGHQVALLPLDAELSTQQAADLMGVSRPYFVKLLEEGRIPYRKVGSQRRVRWDSVNRYIEEYQREAREAMDRMTAEAQEMGLYG